MRSWLFVPADSQKKLEKALIAGADALIVDLEDSVAKEAKPAAREMAGKFISANRASKGPALYVRINPLDSGMASADLDAVMPSGPAGIVLPKACARQSGEQLANMLNGYEARRGIEVGSTSILPIITETAASVTAIASWTGPMPRLSGLTWGAEDLSADLGIANPRGNAGNYTDVFRHARLSTIVAAGACETDAIDTVYIDFRDETGLRRECEDGARDGFTGKLAIHPAQVPVINEVFSVPERDLEEAKRVIAAFADNPDAGVIGIDGKMVDRPHLRRAERILARAKGQKAGN